MLSRQALRHVVKLNVVALKLMMALIVQFHFSCLLPVLVPLGFYCPALWQAELSK